MNQQEHKPKPEITPTPTKPEISPDPRPGTPEPIHTPEIVPEKDPMPRHAPPEVPPQPKER